MTLALCLLTALAAEPAAPPPFVHVAAVEGISEDRLPNGLKLVLVNDPSISTATINLTVFVGSRDEGPGERGQAHLLEHLLYKRTTKTPDVDAAMSAHGANFNGTTREDRTNFYETVSATDANVEWAVRFEAERLVSALITQKDLDAEKTVVRNELESGEDDAEAVLQQRVRATAWHWHPYGHTIIGTRSDLETAELERVQAFYKANYQPDNAMLVVAGRFDAVKVYRWVADAFSRLPKPARKRTRVRTVEPTQDGERFVTVKRVGGAPHLIAAWHVPAPTDDDFPALMVLQGVLGDAPQGRLHQALVDTHHAAKAFCSLDELAEPGLFTCDITLRPEDSQPTAKTALFSTIERTERFTAQEVDRSREGWLSQLEQGLLSSEAVGLSLSEYAAMGDWRLLFVQRDRLRAVTEKDVARVAAAYLKPQNRTLGEYVPVEVPDRADIPPLKDVARLVDGFRGGEGLSRGESFDTSWKNLDARTHRLALQNGGKVTLLSKKTRGQSVVLLMELPYGSAKSLTAARLVPMMTTLLLNRGTHRLSWKAYQNTLERLRATLTVETSPQRVSVWLTVRRPQLAEALALIHDVLIEPELDASSLEALRKEMLANVSHARSDPEVLGSLVLTRETTPLPPTHPDYSASLEEQEEWLRAVTRADVLDFHTRFLGAQAASIAVVGDFDEAAVGTSLEQLFGGWTAKEPYERAADPYVATEASHQVLRTPDMQNAFIGAGLTMNLTDTNADYPALLVGAQVLGDGAMGRLYRVLRAQEGLSYSAGALLDVGSQRGRATFVATAIAAPQNAARAAASLHGELIKWPKITSADVDAARRSLLDQRAQVRSDDQTVAVMLAEHERLGRTMAFEDSLDVRVQAVTAAEVAAAVSKHFDLARLVEVQAGDFHE